MVLRTTRGLLNCLQVDIVGITGRIMFDDNGHRKDYRLDVLELNVDSDPRKVGPCFGFHLKCPFTVFGRLRSIARKRVLRFPVVHPSIRPSEFLSAG